METTAGGMRQHWPWLAAGISVLVLVWLLAPILTPFVVGAGLAYLGDPVVDWLQRRGLSRTAGVCVVFVVLTLAGLALLVIVAPLLYQQFLALLRNIPEWLAWLQDTALPALGVQLPAGVRLDAEGLKTIVAQHWTEAGGMAPVVWAQISKSGGAMLTAAANLLLVPIVSFYLLRDWDDLVAGIADLLPPRWLPKVSELAVETDTMLGSFIRGQLSVMAALAVIYSVGLALAGLDLALVIGVLAGLLSFVPYLGFIVGFGAAALAILVQTQELMPLLWIALVFGIGQVIESAVLTPILVGDRIGLHPVAVIFAVMAGGQLFGFIGVLLALPVAAVLAVLLRHTRHLWLASPLYADGSPAPLPEPPGDATAPITPIAPIAPIAPPPESTNP